MDSVDGALPIWSSRQSRRRNPYCRPAGSSRWVDLSSPYLLLLLLQANSFQHRYLREVGLAETDVRGSPTVVPWYQAKTDEERDQIADVLGIRWSPFNLLPYWNPLRLLGVEAMHMFMRIISKHAREAWHMNINLNMGDGSYDPFYRPLDAMTRG